MDFFGFFLFVALLSAPEFLNHLDEPLLKGDQSFLRNLECQDFSHAEGYRRYPGRIPDTPARDVPDVNEVVVRVCTPRLLPYGERNDRDEAVLSLLSSSVSDWVQTVSALRPGKINWHVDAYYPRMEVAYKIAMATRTSLAEKGLRVSDQVPLLAAGDVASLGRMAPEKSFPTACRLFLERGAMKADDALLQVMLLDAKESQLHAGLCAGGEWQWLK